MVCTRRIPTMDKNGQDKEDIHMLMWAIIFAIVAVVAGFFGFRQVSGTATTIAKVLFVVFLALAIISLFF